MKYINKNIRTKKNIVFGTSKKPTLPIKVISPKSPEIKNVNLPEWFINKNPVDVSIIIPLFRSQNVIKEQIEKWIFEEDGLSKEIIYVDDCCPNKSYEEVIKSWSNKHKQSIGNLLLNKNNSGYGQACNLGAKYALGKYLIFLNADTVVLPNWVKPMIDLLKSNSTIGIVGNLHLKTNGDIDSAGSEWDKGQFFHIGKHIYNGVHLDSPFTERNAPKDMLKVGERQMVTGACFAIKSKLFEEIGGFDPEYIIGYWEDTDLNMKVKEKGYKILFTPESKIYHYGNHSKGGKYANYNKKIFHQKWVNNGILDVLNSKSIDKNKIVIYTAISRNYDSLIEEQNSDGVDFIAYLEELKEYKMWEARLINCEEDDPVRRAKIYKIMPHLFFPNKEYSLWIDGNITIKMPIDKIISKYMKNADIVVHKHHKRKCLYAEAKVCMDLKLDNPTVIKNQISRYRAEGYPSNNGLVEAGMILRKHTPAVQKFNEIWWKEIQKGSRRDQISFNYAARKANVKIEYFPVTFRKNSPLFSMIHHMTNRERYT